MQSLARNFEGGARPSARRRHWRHCSVQSAKLIAAAVLIGLGAGPARATETAEADQIFNRRCTSCHTYGRGIKVGPDLKGVTERRQKPWLLKFIRSSQTVIKAGDPIAKGLFQQFRQQRMPDWSDLSERQITTLLDWIAAGGPEVKAVDERNAEVATPPEIERGRTLFHGEAPLANRGLACITCHSIREDGETTGGSLGPNLTAAYTKFQDRALTLFFRHPCFRRVPESLASNYLTPQESFALKAYLRRAALQNSPSNFNGGAMNHDRQSGGAP